MPHTHWRQGRRGVRLREAASHRHTRHGHHQPRAGLRRWGGDAGGGGNAVDAAVAALFTLTIVEPMMISILGGGMAHIRLADGTHTVVDGQSTAPLATGPTVYTPDPEAPPGAMDTVGRKNAVGPTAVATPGNLMGWCEALERFGTFSLADVMEPAVRHAARGFRVTPYLHECVADTAADLALDTEISKPYMPGGVPIAAGRGW